VPPRPSAMGAGPLPASSVRAESCPAPSVAGGLHTREQPMPRYVPRHHPRRSPSSPSARGRSPAEVSGSRASVVLDFGCCSPEERYAIRAVANCVGAHFALRYVEVDEHERRARAAGRWRTEAETRFPMSDADHDRFLRSFRPPSTAELGYESNSRALARIRGLVALGKPPLANAAALGSSFQLTPDAAHRNDRNCRKPQGLPVYSAVTRCDGLGRPPATTACSPPRSWAAIWRGQEPLHSRAGDRRLIKPGT
jgi:hypothetical protein